VVVVDEEKGKEVKLRLGGDYIGTTHKINFILPNYNVKSAVH
jgi:hypothetical protein